MITDINNLQRKIRDTVMSPDSTTFLRQFLYAFELPVSTIDRLKSQSSYDEKRGVQIGQQLLFLSTESENLYVDLNAIKKQNLSNLKTRFILIYNSKEILAYDIKTEDTLFSSITDLYLHVDFFFPLIGRERPIIEESIAVNIRVSEKFAQFFNECRLSATDITLNSVCELICRILFCCVIDSMGMLTNEGSLYSLAYKQTEESGKDFYSFLNGLFAAMKSENRKELPRCFDSINYIDSRLFAEEVEVISFSRKMRSLILDIMSFDWSNVDPEVLGALIQSIIITNDDSVTGNYTSTANIQKVIGPLFLNSIYSEYEQKKNDRPACEVLVNRIMKIRIFDPSCGCGNFLLVSYKELNKLLSKVASSADYKSIPRMPIKNFYGIETNPYSCSIAKMGLLFVQLQGANPDLSVLREEIDILFNNNIVTGNPTRILWSSVCPSESEVYIIGNPSYKGARKRNIEQNADMDHIFEGYSNYRNLDYAACWFMMATKYIHVHGGAYAFVTTNSLTQGEQVSLLWPKLFDYGVHIRFGHKAFKWRNDARNTTAVTVVIIGVVNNSDKRRCELYSQILMSEPMTISPYLTPSMALIRKRQNPISQFPVMIKGNMPYDGGYLLLDADAKNRIVAQDGRVLNYLRRIVGSDEFINGIERWCIWIPENEAKVAMEIPVIRERVEAVRTLRKENKDKNAQRLASRPYQFREMRETRTNSLVIPSVSSENREYIPVGFIDKKTVVSNLAFVIYDCDPWIFGIISSKMHNLWIRTVCGGLETRIRYSNELGYNTFPFPKISDEQKLEIRRCVNRIIAVREEEPDKTYAQMYKKNCMSDNLKYAHALLDLQIERCYREEPFVNDDERLDCLFDLYDRIGEENGERY